MTNIDNASKLAALMQTQFADGLQRKSKAEIAKRIETSSQKKSATPTPISTGADGNDSIATEVFAQIGMLPLDDAHLFRKAFRIFLQAKLAQHLGVTVANESTFEHLVNEVLLIMEADSDLSKTVQVAGQHLVDLAAQQ